MSDTSSGNFDFDWIVIGSGFGGSVSALRLAEKGYRVAILECGRRYRDEDFAESAWNLRRYFWMPKLGLRGIFRMTAFKDVFIVSGSGVGGGSLGYANTLYRARPAFFRDPQWGELADWEPELTPHYDTAERMLGVTPYPDKGPADDLLREYGEEIGVGDTFKPTRVGAFFGEPGVEVDDPFFGGEGPRRSGCVRCGSCMVGCRHNAKNTLVKNYLWFAEKLGVEILPERQVTDIAPLGAGDGGRRLPGEQPPRRLLAHAPEAEHADGEGRDRRRRRPRDQQAARRLPSPRLPAAAERSHRPRRAQQLGVDPGGHGSRRRARLRPVRRDHLEHLSRSRHARRGRHLRPRRRPDEQAVHRHDRPGHQGDSPAEVDRGDAPPPPADAAAALAVRLVAPHRDPPRHADHRRGHAARPEAPALLPRHPAADRAGSGAPEPDLHTGRGQGRRSGSPSGPAASPSPGSRSRASTSRRPPTSSAAR